MANMFGSDSTKGGVEFQFRTIKADAKRQRDCFEKGADPKDLNIGGGKGISYCLFPHCTLTVTITVGIWY